jgi:hypothetical protein
MLDNFYVGNSEWSQILIEMLDVDKIIRTTTWTKVDVLPSNTYWHSFFLIKKECQYVLLGSTSTLVHVVVRMV